MEPEDNRIMWWGYRHVDGSCQAKPYHPKWGDTDIDDAFDSPFVKSVVGPFPIPEGTKDIREYALDIVRKKTQ